MTDAAALPPEPETREGDLRLAIQSVGLPGDAPWSQVVNALRSNNLADVLPPVEEAAEAAASTDDTPEGSDAVSTPATGDVLVSPAEPAPQPTAAPEAQVDAPADAGKVSRSRELVELVRDHLAELEGLLT